MPKKAYESSWFKGSKTAKEKQDRKVDIAATRFMLDIVRDIVLDYEKKAENTRVSEQKYGEPNWPYLQADKNGEIRAYKKIIDLLEEKT